MFGGYIKVKNFVPRLPHYKAFVSSFLGIKELYGFFRDTGMTDVTRPLYSIDCKKKKKT